MSLNGKSISSIRIASDTSLSFIAPSGIGPGLATLNIEQEETKHTVSLVIEKSSSQPIVSVDKSQICNDMQFYDLDGVLHSGERDCRTNIPDCVADGEVSCKSTAAFKAVDVANVMPGKLKKGVMLAGVMGEYPSAAYPLAGANAAITDLDVATFNARIKSSATFEWFDSTGKSHTHAGDANIKAGFILSGSSVFGTAGTYVPGAMNVSNLKVEKDTGKAKLSWTRNGGTGVLIVRSTGSMVTFAPTHGVNYAQGGSVAGGQVVVFNGSAASVDDISGTAGTYYYYKAFAYNEDMAYSAPSNDVVVQFTNLSVCGGAGDGCYDDAAAIAAGTAVTPSEKNLTYIDNGNGFMVWKDVGSNKILRANGLDEWAMKLNLDGKGFKGAGNEFTDYASLAGRRCPPSVYIDDTKKFSSDNCLYYSNGYDIQSLDAAGTSQTTAAIIGLSTWDTYGARWYVGNINTCATLGMRLPTVYETTTTMTNVVEYPFSDGAPTFAGGSHGIPSHGSGNTWTATSNTSASNSYWPWSEGTVGSGAYNLNFYVRCALP